jgi:hypothetical protein
MLGLHVRRLALAPPPSEQWGRRTHLTHSAFTLPFYRTSGSLQRCQTSRSGLSKTFFET